MEKKNLKQKKVGETPIHKIMENEKTTSQVKKEDSVAAKEKFHTEALEKENEMLKAEIEKTKNDYLRAYADMENMKKRIRNDEEVARKYRIQSFALDILPTLDNFERALLQEIPEGAEGFHKGVEMTYEELRHALQKEGVQEIECLHKAFDANYQQAMMKEKVEGVEPGIVIEVYQKGYMLKDRILRAAMVKVSE